MSDILLGVCVRRYEGLLTFGFSVWNPNFLPSLFQVRDETSKIIFKAQAEDFCNTHNFPENREYLEFDYQLGKCGSSSLGEEGVVCTHSSGLF